MPKGICVAALLGALAVSPAFATPSEPEREAAPVKDEIGKPLEEVAAGKRDPGTLRIDVTWIEKNVRNSTTIFGNGVAIWNDRLQVRLSRAEVLSLARAAKKAGFGAMPSQLGEAGDKPKMIGKMAVSVAGKTKAVVQLTSEESFDALSDLASKTLAVVERHSKNGVAVSSLTDALAKLSTGALAPEVLRVTALRRPERPDGGRGWLLQLDGGNVTARPYERGGFGGHKRLDLSDSDARSLIAALRAGDPEKIPSNLAGPDYMELRIEALSASRDILARRPPGPRLDAQDDREKAFARVMEVFARLEERVEKEGRPD